LSTAREGAGTIYEGLEGAASKMESERAEQYEEQSKKKKAKEPKLRCRNTSQANTPISLAAGPHGEAALRV